MGARGDRLLRIAFLAGAITDFFALLPMLFPQLARLLWDLRDLSASYRFAMGYGASLMFGWTLLLLWAYRCPRERRFVAVLTVLVICGLVVTEVATVHSGALKASRMLPVWFLQAILLVLFVGAYYHSAARGGLPPGTGRDLTSHAGGNPPAARGPALRHYTLSCGLLLLPIFLWNAAFTRSLPPAYTMAEFWRDIPSPLAFLENSLRGIVSVLPFLMPLQLTSVLQRRGLLVYGIGAALYFCAWAAVMIAPRSPWAASPAGFLAPACTPLIWLVGIALLGQRLYWGRSYRWWMFLIPAGGFTAAHVGHTALVYARNS